LFLQRPEAWLQQRSTLLQKHRTKQIATDLERVQVSSWQTVSAIPKAETESVKREFLSEV